MPTFAVYTNLPKDKIPGDFLQQTSAFLAKQLEKPESIISLIKWIKTRRQQLRVHPDQLMTLGGTAEPCASVELYNITDGAKTKEDAVAIANFLENTLSIPQSRFYITFTNLRGEDISHGGKTFA